MKHRSSGHPSLVTVMRVCVLGAGSYGTAMAVVSTFNANDVMMYMRSAEQAEAINMTHKNPKRFADTELPVEIKATNKFEVALHMSPSTVHFS